MHQFRVALFTFAVIGVAHYSLCASQANAQTGWGQAPQGASSVPWLTDLEQAKRLAKQKNLPILLHFWGPHCRPCLKLESFVFNNPQVIRALSTNVIPVKIQDQIQPELFAEFGVKKMPTDVVISADGAVIFKRPSPNNTDGYLRLLKAVANLNESKSSLRYRVADQKTREHLDRVRSRDVELQQQNLARRGMKFDPGAEGSVYRRSPVNLRNTSPDTSALLTDVPQVERPSVNRPQHSMPQPNTRLQPNTLASQAKDKVAEIPRTISGSSTEGVRRSIGNPHFQKRAAKNHENHRHTVASNPGPVRKSKGQDISNQFYRKQRVSQSFVPAMDGFCPVTLMDNEKFVRGDKDWGCFHRGKLFLFANQECRDQFMNHPDIYFPAMAGIDPVTFQEQGKRIDSGIATGVRVEFGGQKMMVLFSSQDSKAKFLDNREKYLDTIRRMEQNHSVLRTANSAIPSKIR